jgi:hypothetical protein
VKDAGGAAGAAGAGAREGLRDLARESGRILAELGVRASDEKWIREHARTIAGLELAPSRRGLAGLWSLLSRK